MGFLPIIVAILGFTFLWGIVNYYSIRQRKAEAEKASQKVFAAAENRNILLKQLSQESFSDKNQAQLMQYIGKQMDAQQPGQIPIKEKLSAENKISELIRDIPPMDTDNRHQLKYQELLHADKAFRQAASIYRARSSEYNELISKNPSKLLALLIGFKPLT